MLGLQSEHHTGFVSEFLKSQSFAEIYLPRPLYALPHPVSFKACCRILKSRGCHTALVPDSYLSLSHCQSLRGVLSPRALQAPLEGFLVMVLGVSPEALNEFIQHMTKNLLPLGPTWLTRFFSMSAILYQPLVLYNS